MTAKQFITQLFSRWELGDAQGFFNVLAEDLRCTVIGDTPISGTCTSLIEYLEKVYRPLFERFTGPVQCQVKNIIAEGDTVVVQWRGKAPMQSGTPYMQDYCWVIR
jgi:ketosteroid isomerase-like protein